MTSEQTSDGRTGSIFGYDVMGQITLQKSLLPSTYTATISAGYDLAGDMTILNYPDGRALTEAYNGKQQLQSVIFDNWEVPMSVTIISRQLPTIQLEP